MKAIVVTGTHRAHTSLVAGGLAERGIPTSVGGRELKQGHGNPLGHFECLDMMGLNNRILQAAGGTWDDPPPVDGVEAVADRFADECAAYVARRAADADVWAVKDPRLAVTWPVWRRHMPADTTVVQCWRRPETASLSLNARDGRTDGAAITDEYRRRMGDPWR